MVRKINFSKMARFLAASLTAGLSAHAMAGTDADHGLVRGKSQGRSIRFEVIIPGSPQQVFESWTTEAEANRFFGISSNIEPQVGGLYEIKFEGQLPDGRAPGTRGTQILHFEENKALAFEWQAPFFADELNTSPLPTWVELTFEPQPGVDHSTVLTFIHFGFGEGEAWDRVYTFFERNWFEVLFRLRALYESGSLSHRESHEPDKAGSASSFDHV